MNRKITSMRTNRNHTELSVSIHEAGHAFAVWSIGEINIQLSINMQGCIVSRFGVTQEDYIKGQSEYIPSFLDMGFPDYWVNKMLGIVTYAGRFAEQMLCDREWSKRCTDPLTAYYDIVDPESDDLEDDEEQLLKIALRYPYIKMRQLEKYWATQVWDMINNQDARRTINALSEWLRREKLIVDESIDWFIREQMKMNWNYPRYHLIPKTVRMKVMGAKLYRFNQLVDETKWRKLNERIATTGRIWS